jgi:redox-sensitive bicupin YhaK (pirin superfamily)
MYNLKLNAGKTESFNLKENYNSGILVVEGSVKVNGSDLVPADHFVLLKNDGQKVEIEAQTDAILLVLSGEPIKEPIFAHGPFLMNTREEIIQAFEDYENGKFGHLED